MTTEECPPWEASVPSDTWSVRKYPTFFCENLVDLNEAPLHEATFNLHSNTCIFSRLSLSSVDGKQHLSEVEFSALVGFSL